MLHLQSIFAKAANAIVEASQLRKEVAALQAQMTQLSNSFEQLKASNEQLVNELHVVRQEKKELQDRLHSAEAEVNSLKFQLETVTSQRDRMTQEVNGLRESLDSAHREIDNLNIETLERADTIQELKAQVDKIRQAHEEFVKASARAHDALSAVIGVEVVKEAASMAEEAASFSEWKAENVEASPVPFGQSFGSGEQPRAENGRFEPTPMAARHFE